MEKGLIASALFGKHFRVIPRVDSMITISKSDSNVIIYEFLRRSNHAITERKDFGIFP